MIYVIIPVHNRINDTMAFIRCCALQETKNFQLIIVDDGSTDGTYDTVKNLYPWIVCIRGNGNLWWTGAINMGVSHARSICQPDDLIMTINNDVRFGPQFFGDIEKTALLHPKSVFNPISVSQIDQKTVFFTGTKVLSWFFALKKQPYFGKPLSIAQRRGIIEVDYLNGRGTTIPVKVFQEIGNYNQSMLPHYGADEEFTLRAKRNGYRLFIDPMIQVSVDSQTTGLNPLNKNLSLSEMIESFTSIKSTNNIRILYRYSKCCSPAYALPSYFIISLLKICLYTLRSLVPVQLKVI